MIVGYTTGVFDLFHIGHINLLKNAKGMCDKLPERKQMWRAQTPQAFRLWVIRDAYQRALQDPTFTATDDCGVVRKYLPEMKIHVVEGEERNRKITFPEDMEKNE